MLSQLDHEAPRMRRRGRGAGWLPQYQTVSISPKVSYTDGLIDTQREMGWGFAGGQYRFEYGLAKVLYHD